MPDNRKLSLLNITKEGIFNNAKRKYRQNQR